MAGRKYSKKPALGSRTGGAKAPASRAMYGGAASARKPTRKVSSKAPTRRRKK